jgi:DNA invertase Pin-like site-specific DNA recombinase
MHTKIQESHKNRTACIYIRQSTTNQVRHNQESTQRQYALQEKASQLGWSSELIRVMDGDLGLSGASSSARNDFKALVAEVSMKKVGAVFALEASRLARSCTDWHRLLELCAMTRTVIIDEDGCYDPAEFNDQLLLGLKGTMSQAELHFIHARLQGGRLSKAQKGELRTPLPVGFCYGDDGTVSLDADVQVREAVKLVFETFKRVGTAHRVARDFAKRKLMFPRRIYGGVWSGKLTWGRLTHGRVRGILKNPCYAGVYAFGRYHQRKEITADGKIVSMQAIRPMNEWTVTIKDHHDSYISFDEYLQNQRMLAANSPPRDDMMSSGAAREGMALLQGMILCGSCGRRLGPKYKSTKYGIQPLYRCDWKQREGIEKGCMTVPATLIDDALSARVLQVIQPDQLRIALSALEQLEYRESALTRQWQMKIERANYEAQLAQKRYEEVDPSNRLVAATLESRWNDALQRLEEVKQQAAEYEKDHCVSLTENQKDKILRLAQDLPALWQSKTTKPEDKKRILRLLIGDVTVERPHGASDAILHVRWASGATEDIVVQLPIAMHERRRYALPAIERVRVLASKLSDSEICVVLNREGILSSSGKPFTEAMIRWIRHKYRIPAMSSRQSQEMVVDEVAQKFGVTKHTVYYWIEHKLITARKDQSGRYLIRLSSTAETKLRAIKGGAASKERSS